MFNRWEFHHSSTQVPIPCHIFKNRHYLLKQLTYLGLDMTTALVSHCPRIPQKIQYEPLDPKETGPVHVVLAPTERLDLVPNFYAYSVKSCLLPIQKVQDQLITHYFCHVHPMFPLVDEYRFSKLHQKYRGQEELMNAADFMVYHAIMVAGFAVRSIFSF